MTLHSDSNADSLDKAMQLCIPESYLDEHNVVFHIRPIGEIVKTYQQGGIALSQLGEGNIRSRIRANILYDFAGSLSGLVVGTGNKDEDEIGYFTKGGDGLVDLCPLSKIHKSQVRYMAEILGVSHEIIDAAPSAGLWDGQTDEDELGMTYDEVEWAIRYDELDGIGAEHDFGFHQPVQPRHNEVLAKVGVLRKQNEHKLKYPPVFDPS